MNTQIPLVLLHGALNNADIWAPVLPSLPEALVLDLPGHGENRDAPLPTLEALADWVWLELDRRGLGSVILVGHSMGSLIALEAAARQAARAQGLVMIGTAFPMRVSPALLEMAASEPENAIALVDEYSRALPDPHSQLLKLMMRESAANPDLLRHDLRLCDSYTGALAAAEMVRCRVQMILGEQDRMTPPRKAQALADALRATVHTLPCGHALMSEAAAKVAEILKEPYP